MIDWRPAEKDDLPFVDRVATHPDCRSWNPEHLDYSALCIYIIPGGCVFVEPTAADEACVHVAVMPLWRGPRAVAAVRGVLAFLLAGPVKKFHAFIKADNRAACVFAVVCGGRRVGVVDGYVQYQMEKRARARRKETAWDSVKG